MQGLALTRIFSRLPNTTAFIWIAAGVVAFIYIRGMDAQHAGFILISQAGVQSVISLYAGKLSDKVNPALPATSGMAIIVLGLVGLIFLSATISFVYLIFLLTLLGVGFGLFSSPNTNVIMSSMERKYFGQASATMGTMRLTGQAFSMGIAMIALSLHVGNKMIVPELHRQFMKSMHITFLICAVLCIGGTYASSFRTGNKTKKRMS